MIIASRARPTATAFVFVAGALVLGAAAPPAGAADRTTPSSPGAGYTLDWENATDRTLPAHAPNGWHEQYLPELRHNDGGEPQVRVASATAGEPVRAGAHSVRFELDRTDPLVSNGVRAEIEASPPEPLNAERWYGFSTFLPASYSKDPMSEIIVQWHQYGGTCVRGCSPPLSILTKDGQYWISQNWQIQPPDPTYHFGDDTPIGQYSTNEWTDWVVHVKWSLGNDGILEIWKDGQPIPGFNPKIGRNDDYGDRVNPNGTLKPTAGVPQEQLPRWGNYMVLGLYKWGWRDRITEFPVTRKVLYTDELRITDGSGSYAAVAPRGTSTTTRLMVTGALQVTPGAAGAATQATFTVTNNGGTASTVPYFLVGARTASGGNVDFPAGSAVTLQPGQSHTYRASRVLPAGSYTAWPSYFDGRNWRELAPRTTFTDPS